MRYFRVVNVYIVRQEAEEARQEDEHEVVIPHRILVPTRSEEEINPRFTGPQHTRLENFLIRS
jgi:hypothetical protein